MDIIAFFDIDNTLIRSSRGHVEALLVCIAEVYGIDALIDVINHHGMTDQEIITRILEKYEIDQAAIKARLADCMACMVRKYAAIVKSEEIVAMPGASNLLDTLEQHGIILGLVTGNLEHIGVVRKRHSQGQREISSRLVYAGHHNSCVWRGARQVR